MKNDSKLSQEISKDIYNLFICITICYSVFLFFSKLLRTILNNNKMLYNFQN